MDFLVLGERGERRLIQVCASLAEPKTRKRELGALAEAMKELALKKGIIVTSNEAEYIPLDGGSAEALYAWKFCLTLLR